MTPNSHRPNAAKSRGHYRNLLWMGALSFLTMYALMYAMVDRFDNALGNLNQAYMAGLMALPMIVIEIALMRAMYSDARFNVAIVAICAAGTVALWFAIREQEAISDEQFLRSMIPHHAGPVLMCDKADLSDPATIRLCRQITRSQEAEIALMKKLLAAS